MLVESDVLQSVEWLNVGAGMQDVPLPPKPGDAFTRPLQGKWNWNLWRS